MYVKPIDYVPEEKPKRPRGRPKGTTGTKHRPENLIRGEKIQRTKRANAGIHAEQNRINLMKMNRKGAVMGDVSGNKGKFVAKVTGKDAAIIEAAVNHMLKQFVHEIACGLLDVDYTVKAEVTRRKDQLSIMRETINTIKQLKELATDIREESGEQSKTPEEAVENIQLMDQAKELLAKVSKA